MALQWKREVFQSEEWPCWCEECPGNGSLPTPGDNLVRGPACQQRKASLHKDIHFFSFTQTEGVFFGGRKEIFRKRRPNLSLQGNCSGRRDKTKSQTPVKLP